MPKPELDVVDHVQEDLIRRLSNAETHPNVVNIIVEMHDQIITLQRAVNDILTQHMQLLQAVKLSQSLHQAHTESVNKMLKRYSDPDRDRIQSEDIN